MMFDLEEDGKRIKIFKLVRGKIIGFSINAIVVYILRKYLLFVFNCGLKNF